MDWILLGLWIGFALISLLNYFNTKEERKIKNEKREQEKEHAMSQIEGLKEMRQIARDEGYVDLVATIQQLINRIEADYTYASSNFFMLEMMKIIYRMFQEMADKAELIFNNGANPNTFSKN